MFSTIFKSAGMFLIAIILGLFKESIVFFMAFSILRVHNGGYHSDSYLKCFITSSLSFFTTIIIGKILFEYITFPVVIILLLFAIMIVFKYAPIESENKPLGIKRKAKFKKRSRIIVIVESIVIISILLLNKELIEYGVLMTLAVTLLAITSIPFKTIFNNMKERRLLT